MEVVEIRPNLLDLEKPQQEFKCPIPQCLRVFRTAQNVSFHLARTHQHVDLLKPSNPLVQKVYFCPVSQCPHHMNQPFRHWRNLKQHYSKVHMEKSERCTRCRQKYVLKHSHLHMEFCGVQFHCLDCNLTYASYETLLTHCRRHKHRSLPKSQYKLIQLVRLKRYFRRTKYRKILPKFSEQSSQTGTNTNPYYRKSIKTQTNAIVSKTISCNTFFNNDKLSASSSTQTLIGDAETSEANGTFDDVETVDFEAYLNNCDIETQTDEEGLFFDQDLFGDWLLNDPEISLSDTHTQTGYDILKSVESQTVPSHLDEMDGTRLPVLTHMETQTCDLEFKRILDELKDIC